MARRRVSDSIDPALRHFAQRLQDQMGAERVLLFGSHAHGTAGPESDYDIIVVAPCFRTIPRLKRTIGLRNLFYEVGGNAPMDLICLTPEEFAFASSHLTLVNQVLPEAIDLLPASR